MASRRWLSKLTRALLCACLPISGPPVHWAAMQTTWRAAANPSNQGHTVLTLFTRVAVSHKLLQQQWQRGWWQCWVHALHRHWVHEVCYGWTRGTALEGCMAANLCTGRRLQDVCAAGSGCNGCHGQALSVLVEHEQPLLAHHHQLRKQGTGTGWRVVSTGIDAPIRG